MKSKRKKLRLFVLIACMLVGGMGIYANSTKASDYDSWPELSLSTTGGTVVSSGNYKITNDITINATEGTSGFIISGNVNLYIPSGKTITTKGGDGSGATVVGGAGIEIPDTALLQLFGEGTINATGGKGGIPGNAKNGGDGWSGGQGENTNGSAGGSGSGAGIGGKGGKPSTYVLKAAMAMGKLYIHDQMKVNSTGGTLPTFTQTRAIGGSTYVTSTAPIYYRSGGGAGGGGGSGYYGSNIGAGGAGGGAGGSGIGSGGTNNGGEVGSGGGGGGMGAIGGLGAQGSDKGLSGTDGTPTHSGTGGKCYPGAGDGARDGYKTDTSASGGFVYISRTATVTSSLPEGVDIQLYGNGATSNMLEEIVLEPAQTGVTITKTGPTKIGGVAGDTLLSLSELPVADHYTFQGYYSQASGQGTKYINADGTATTTTWNSDNTKLFANWTPMDYSITYNLDGGTVTGNPTTYTIESEDIILKAPTKANYVFKGWKKDGSETVETSATIPKGSTGNVSYSAVWLQEYTITYNLDGGNATGNPTTYTIESENIILKAPTKANHIFKGWKKDGSETVETSVTIPKGSTGNLTYSAVWLQEYTITYNLDGGSDPGNPMTYTVESEDITLKAPTKADYAFKGWKQDGSDIVEPTVIITKGSSGNKTYYAVWAEIHTVKFNSQGGSNVSDVLVEQNNVLIKPVNPSRKGYKLEGWYKEESCQTAWDFSDPVTSNMTLYASWQLDPTTETEYKDINTTDTSKDQEGTIYGSLSGSVLTQLKAEVPIKLDFAVAPEDGIIDANAPSKANKFFVGDYKIKVASDSEAGLEVNGVQILQIGGWKLDTAANIEQLVVDEIEAKKDLSKQKTISLSMAGKELKTGINTFDEDEFTVAVSATKSLEIKGTAGRVWLDAGIQAKPENAFRIVYIISQKR